MNLRKKKKKTFPVLLVLFLVFLLCISANSDLNAICNLNQQAIDMRLATMHYKSPKIDEYLLLRFYLFFLLLLFVYTELMTTFITSYEQTFVCAICFIVFFIFDLCARSFLIRNWCAKNY